MYDELVLDDGTRYVGQPFGAKQPLAGEVVFNTGMVGYPESLTDPSYRGQILVLTYPLVGNYGVPPKPYWESERIQVAGLIVSEPTEHYSHWQAQQSLAQWLKHQGVPALSGIDTRALTKQLRQHGVMLAGNQPDPNTRNLVAEVSCRKPVWYGRGKKQVIVVDCGVKASIISNLVKRGVKVKRVPWNYPFAKELKHYAGVVLSNGPGDPTQCVATIEQVKLAMQSSKPIFGICLGSQIQGLAAGAKTYKLKFGHRAQNQPCIVEGSQRVWLTSQNHGFAVKESTLPRAWQVSFRNANDQSVEGIRHRSKPWWSVQFHPEAMPGPQDANRLFDEFVHSL